MRRCHILTLGGRERDDFLLLGGPSVAVAQATCFF
jgi:hypothetical protein